MLPADVGGANWPGGSFDPETNRLYIHSHTAVFTLQNIPADLEPFDPGPAARTGAAPAAAAPPPAPPAVASARGPAHWERNRGQEVLAASTFLQGTIPLIKPPYDRITAYDMNTGEMLWQKAAHHDARQHPQQPCPGGTRCCRDSAPTAGSSSAR